MKIRTCLFLVIVLSITACNRKVNNRPPVSESLSIQPGGYNVAGVGAGEIIISDEGAYQKKDGHITQLSSAVFDSLKPYKKEFPHSKLKAEGKKPLSMLGAADGLFITFTMKQNDSVTYSVAIDVDKNGDYGPPEYMTSYMQRLRQTLDNCKLQ
ncbi:MAG TPA: hypothetical protein VM802_02080 [Chitinophaga sp.]|uniref:hypothetical protein n=1 Tax=Chitinophaga sp. TaxID=1869181 RepID=UPI002B79F6F3|nr:hypothetical protein [Chitinophaga sp.]HVI43622.1 hypothetical protein [Chitinophaga sp.]